MRFLLSRYELIKTLLVS